MRHAPGLRAETPDRPGRNGHPPTLLTEQGAAAAFVERFGKRFRYDVSSGHWRLYRRGRWATDEKGVVVRAVKRYAAESSAALISHPAPGVDPKTLLKFCVRIQSAAGIAALLRLAETEQSIPVTAAELDADAFAINTLNGTIDGRTGQLRDHRPEDLCTKQCPTHFDPEATCPLWDSFLERVMGGSAEMIGYLRRLAGMCLTADVGVQELFVFWGGGANGKSVFLDTLSTLMGDYAGEAAPSLLTTRSGFEEHPTEIADLAGKRLVIGSETEEGSRLRVQLVKRLTGNATLKARRMRCDYFEFPRTHKLVLVTNNRPAIRETSHAIWRRVRLIPWTVTIPEAERDERLMEKLRAEWPGILAWAVRGCVEWQREGLRTPEAVTTATKNYRADQNVLREFVTERCVKGPHLFTPRASIFAAYTEWAKGAGERDAMDRHAFYDRLRSVEGVEEDQARVNGTPTRGFRGIAAASLGEQYREAQDSVGRSRV